MKDPRPPWLQICDDIELIITIEPLVCFPMKILAACALSARATTGSESTHGLGNVEHAEHAAVSVEASSRRARTSCRRRSGSPGHWSATSQGAVACLLRQLERRLDDRDAGVRDDARDVAELGVLANLLERLDDGVLVTDVALPGLRLDAVLGLELLRALRGVLAGTVKDADVGASLSELLADRPSKA